MDWFYSQIRYRYQYRRLGDNQINIILCCYEYIKIKTGISLKTNCSAYYRVCIQTRKDLFNIIQAEGLKRLVQLKESGFISGETAQNYFSHINSIHVIYKIFLLNVWRKKNGKSRRKLCAFYKI